MKLPNADRAIVDMVKLSEYALNQNRPRGRHNLGCLWQCWVSQHETWQNVGTHCWNRREATMLSAVRPMSSARVTA